jgi:hypothetical protein
MTQSTCTLPARPLLTARGRAGAARVSIIWLITLIILFFVALGFGYVGFGEAAKEREGPVPTDILVGRFRSARRSVRRAMGSNRFSAFNRCLTCGSRPTCGIGVLR